MNFGARYCVALFAATLLIPTPANAAAPADSAAADTFSRVVTLPVTEVSTTRFTSTSPIARTTLDRREVLSRTWGQDTPMAIASMPDAYAYSDAGNGVGYSYLSIRGFPQRRISVLIDGVPLNDPESHEVYWIDHPDLLASTAEVTMQRGVGAALYGAAAVGGSVNLTTSPFTHAPEQRLTVDYGSFETKRLTFEGNSGDLDGGWNLYGRYSRISSFGYRDQSWSKLWSYLLAARKLVGRQSFQVNLFGGPEETHLAYYGLSPEAMAEDRRFNPLTFPDERDHFFEPHYVLLHNWAPSERLSISNTVFYFDGKGYYDEQRFEEPLASYRLASWTTTDSTLAPRDYYQQDASGALTQDVNGKFTIISTDVVRRRTIVDQHYGWLPRASWQQPHGTLIVGGEMRWHDGHHYGAIQSGSNLPPGTGPNPLYYDFHPRTFSGGIFAREEWNPSAAFSVTADAAWRHQSYDMRGDNFDGVNFIQSYDFFLPRLGLAWQPGKRAVALFASWAQTSREPALQNLYDGEDYPSAPLFAHQDPATHTWTDPLIRPERVNDFEVGAAWSGGSSRAPDGASGPAAALTVNLFRMDFRDELVDAGQFNTDLGVPEVANAARSLHEGVELAGMAARSLGRTSRAVLDGNATFSDNHFIDYVEYDDLGNPSTFNGNTIGLFPDLLVNLELRVESTRGWLAAATHSAGRMYMDNSQENSRSIDPHTVLDLSGGTGFRLGASRLDLTVRLLNATNLFYDASGYGYTYLGVRYAEYIPAATRNYMAQVSMRF